MSKNLIENILPELKAESAKARDAHLVNHPDDTLYDYYKNINDVTYVFKWSKDQNVANPRWHFKGYKKR